MTSDFAPEVAK